MTGEETSASDLARVRETVQAWARACGEPHPKNVRVVYTTRDAAAGLLHPGVRSDLNPCYFVTLEGWFDLPVPEDAPRRTGPWAALCINPESMKISPYTVRPQGDALPDLPMGRLGTVHTLAFG
ncbi:hypothetical protein [Streptomyces noursei]|uniref:hypothetical protein n=1 Tax=Streptomyces noursei TaxID=1971 RepID=UPI0011DDDFE9|nr:hypothetical protein [Streptomyces noursei]